MDVSDILFLQGWGRDHAENPGPSYLCAQAVAKRSGGEVCTLRDYQKAQSLEDLSRSIQAWQTNTFLPRPFGIVASSFGALATLRWIRDCDRLPRDYRGSIFLNPFLSPRLIAAGMNWFQKAIVMKLGLRHPSGQRMPPWMVRSIIENDVLRGPWVDYLAKVHPNHQISVVITKLGQQGPTYDPVALEHLVVGLGLKSQDLCSQQLPMPPDDEIVAIFG